MSNKDIVDQFFTCWSNGDLDGSMSLCTEDAVWDNVPMKPVVGKAAISAFLGAFAKGMTDVHYEVKGVLEDANVLMLEGTENYTKNGRKVSVPYMAAFRFRDGKICSWSDYFDLATVERQLAG